MKERQHTPEDAEDFKIYQGKDKDNTHYSEKTGHKARTLAHDTRPTGHRKHFNKTQ